MGTLQNKSSGPNYDLGLQWSNEPIKILGVYLGYDKAETANRNFRSKLLDLEKNIKLMEDVEINIYRKDIDNKSTRT